MAESSAHFVRPAWQDRCVTEPQTPAPAQSSAKSFYSGAFDREEVDTATPMWRRAAAVVIMLIGVALFAIYLWTTVTSSSNVFLKSHFGALTSGVFVLLLFALLAFAVGYPVRATVEQRRRSRVRTSIIVVAAVSLIVAVFIHALGLFKYQPTVVANSPSGTRHAAILVGYETTTLRIFEGSGLGKHEVGNVGVLCGMQSQDRISFDGDNSLKVSTPFNDFVIPLDPKTGAPLKHFGARCDAPAQ
jgi:hypothetical protein